MIAGPVVTGSQQLIVNDGFETKKDKAHTNTAWWTSMVLAIANTRLNIASWKMDRDRRCICYKHGKCSVPMFVYQEIVGLEVLFLVEMSLEFAKS